MIDFHNPWLAVALWSGGAALAAWLAFPRSSMLEAARARFTRESGAYLDPGFIGSFDARTRRNYRLRALSLLAAVSGLVFALRETHVEPILIMAPLLGVTLVLESLDRLSHASREFVVADHRSATARPRRVVLSDYVPLTSQLLTWGGAAVPVVTAAGVLVHRHEIGVTVTAVVTVGATIILCLAVLTAWFGKALCERPTPAVDASHLYLQDAWRAEALTRAHLLLRLNAALFATGAVGSAPAVGYGFGMGVAVAAALVLTGSVALPAQQFRRRLWGTLPPGQVLLPGQAVPPRVGAGA